MEEKTKKEYIKPEIIEELELDRKLVYAAAERLSTNPRIPSCSTVIGGSIEQDTDYS
ncbi:MAG: hypothetical protein ACOX2F_12065 [bacterium]